MEKEIFGKPKSREKRTMSMEFLASISHEIRNPVNMIIGLVHLLKSTEKEEDRKRYTEELENTSSFLLELVNSIMDFTKVDAGKLNYEFKSVNIQDTISQSLAGYRTLAEAKGLEFIVEISDELPIHVYTDPVKINQVILNLISNSLKFTKKGYIRLIIGVEQFLKDSVVLKFQIEDSGPGIPDEKIKSIFNVFEQASDEINLKFGGTGIGLSICKEVISTLGGDIQVYSQVGVGTCFTFTLSLPISTKDTGSSSHPEIDNGKSLGKKILIVDDSYMNTMLLRKSLEKEQFNTLVAHNAFKAIKLLQTEDVDLILLDINMPEMNGIEAAEVIRNLPGLSQIPIIAVTGSTDLSSLQKIKNNSFSDFILKPFHPEEMSQKLRIILSNHRLDE